MLGLIGYIERTFEINDFHPVGEYLMLPTSNSVSEEMKDLFSQYARTIQITEYLDFNWSHRLSSGEQSMLTMLSRFWSAHCYDSVTPDTSIKNNVLVLIDEGDLHFHPEWQRRFFDDLIHFLPRCFPDRFLQLIATSNSPFILSDIPPSNVIFIRKGGRVDVAPSQDMVTFGANIHDLFRYSFFMEGGLTGEFATQRIKAVIAWLNDEQMSDASDTRWLNRETALTLIHDIGEPLLRRKLEEMYIEKYGKQLHKWEAERIIAKRESELCKLKKTLHQEESHS
jgi:hypothetical protein